VAVAGLAEDVAGSLMSGDRLVETPHIPQRQA
jgi:hypothetical protein